MMRTLVFLSFLLVAASAVAQPEAAPPGGDQVAAQPGDIVAEQGYVPAESVEVEPVPGGTFMLISYLALWLVIGGYLFRLASRHRAVQAELGVLRRLLEDIDDRLNELS